MSTSVLNGLPPGDFPVSIFDVVLKRLTIRGSIVGTRKDMQEALQFAAEDFQAFLPQVVRFAREYSGTGA